MSQANQLAGTGRMVTLTRGIVWCVLVIAVLAGVTTLAIGVANLVTNLIDGHTAMALTVAQKLPPAADAGSATVVSGNYETAYVVLSKLSGGAVTLALGMGLLLVGLAFEYGEKLQRDTDGLV
ncbi:hypothetical protein [Glaciihabitans sp. UYNi722]|uniref:hypothetical protein n=1 Tax=Glaciihabitans sp. UYNi722 TaxID=3156344 RepID=UPI003396EB97